MSVVFSMFPCLQQFLWNDELNWESTTLFQFLKTILKPVDHKIVYQMRMMETVYQALVTGT